MITNWLPSIFAAAAAFGAWSASIHNRKATEYSTEINARENHHGTESKTLLEWNAQLIHERQALAERLDEIQYQLVNSHKTNLRDDLSELITDVRSLREDVTVISDRLIAVENRVG